MNCKFCFSITQMNATGKELDSSLPNGLYVNEPTQDKHVTNKSYVDAQSKELEEKIDEIKLNLNDKVDELNGEAEGLKLKGTTYADFENSKILVNTPDDSSDSKQVINKEYADTKVKKVGGEAKDLTLSGNIKANGNDTHIEINSPVLDNHPVNKKFLNDEINKIDEKIGNLNDLEAVNDLEKVNIVNAINNATTKNEVAELLLRYVFADEADDDFSPIEDVNLTYVYKAEMAINDGNGNNIAESISELRESIVPSITEENVVNLIANHNNSTAINGLIGGADGAYDTLKDIENELKDNDSSITEILTSLSKKASTDQLQAVEDKIPTGAAADYNIATSITGSDNLATDKAVKDFVENKKYLTGITSEQVTNALEYTPYNAETNLKGFITSSDNVNSATNATNDANGNNIGETYATKDEIADFVKITVVDNVIIIG